jgi:putative endonuclease
MRWVITFPGDCQSPLRVSYRLGLARSLDLQAQQIYDHEMSKKTLGAFGEEVAVRELEGKGYRILDRNWRVQEGEIDVIAEHEGEIVFVEVKTRTSDLYGGPEDSITKQKRNRIIRASLAYLLKTERLESDWRVDLIGIHCTPEKKLLRVEHYESVIEGSIEDFL